VAEFRFYLSRYSAPAKPGVLLIRPPAKPGVLLVAFATI
jgi:hypothetical protein